MRFPKARAKAASLTPTVSMVVEASGASPLPPASLARSCRQARRRRKEGSWDGMGGRRQVMVAWTAWM